MTDPISRLNAALEDRYVIARELGAGGMATVYLARDLRHERDVAVKVLKPDLAAVIGGERFLGEIRTTANLQHSHILPLYDSGSADGFLFYVMPYVEGESLRERLDRERQLPVDEAVRITTDLADALDYAHRQGVIHRDIKPANIMLREGRPLIADFGIALAVGGGGRLTETGLSVGTPFYMSPEQATGDQSVGPPSDIYSLACMLFEMLTGDPPYVGSTAQAVLGQIIAGERVSPRKKRAAIPSHVDAAIRKGLEKLPADRFRSASKLSAVLADPGFRYDPHGSAGASVDGTRPWLRYPQSRIALAAAAALLLILGWHLFGPRPEPAVLFLEAPVPDSLALRRSALALSPDGNALVVRVRGPDRVPMLAVRHLDRLGYDRIEGTEGARAWTYSPDGERLAFTVSGDRLAVVSLRDGTVQTIRDGGVAPFTVAWGEDDRIYHGLRGGGVVSVDPRGPDVDTVADGVGFTMIHDALPGGRGVLYGIGGQFFVYDARSNESLLLLEGVSTARYLPSGHLALGFGSGPLQAVEFDLGSLSVRGDPVGILPEYQSPGWGRDGLDVAPDGTVAFMPQPATNDYELVLVGRNGAEDFLPFEAAEYEFPRLSPDGRRAVVEIHDAPSGQLFVADLSSGTLTPITLSGHNSRPEWSPDGTLVVYEHVGDDEPEGVYVVPVRRSEPPRMVVAGEGAKPQWTPDGDTVLFERGGEIHAIPVDESGPSRLLFRSVTPVSSPALSPDGRWLAYVTVELGSEQLYVTDLEGDGGSVRISPDQAQMAFWASSGEELLYRSGDWLFSATLDLEDGAAVLGRERLFDLAPYDMYGDDIGNMDPSGEQFLLRKPRTQDVSPVIVKGWSVPE